MGRYAEARLLLLISLKKSREAFGENETSTLLLRESYAEVTSKDPEATEDDLLEAEATLDALLQRSLRVYGENHPNCVHLHKDLDRAKAMLRLFRARAARAAETTCPELD